MEVSIKNQPVIIYDGACGFCLDSVRLVQRLDRHNRLAYLDAQDWAAVIACFPQLDREAVLGRLHVVTAEAYSYAGFDAMRIIMRELPPVAWLVPLLYLPGMTWIGRRVYDWVARHRYTISRMLGRTDLCEDSTCRVGSPPRR